MPGFLLAVVQLGNARQQDLAGTLEEVEQRPELLTATIYEKLGIDRQRPLYTSNRRPVYFGHGGQPIRELF